MNFKTTPFSHQRDAFYKLYELPYSALLADMGTGKTKIGIDVAAYQEVTHLLVIAPKQVCAQWPAELETHYLYNFTAYVYESPKSQKKARAQDTFLAYARRAESPLLYVAAVNNEAFLQKHTVDFVRAFLQGTTRAGNKGMIIIDEASRIKNPEAKSVKAIKKLSRAFPDCTRMIMTGTPAAKSPVDMYSLFDFLKQNYFKRTYAAFKREFTYVYECKFRQAGVFVSRQKTVDYETYSKMRKDVFAGAEVEKIAAKYGVRVRDLLEIVAMTDFVNAKNASKLKELIAPVSYSIKKSECFDLPEKLFSTLTVTMTKQQKEALRQLQKYALYVGANGALTLKNKASLGLRVLQVCGGFVARNLHTLDEKALYDCVPLDGGNPKLRALKDDISEVGTQQFIVWSVFQPELELLARELRGIAVYVTSDDTHLIEAFKEGSLQGVIMHPVVGGYGLNLQNCGLQYWFSRDYRTEVRLQAEDRSHRYGIDKSPLYRDIVCDCKFERNVLAVLRQGRQINDMFTDTGINDIF